jgi:hypothetical protein
MIIAQTANQALEKEISQKLMSAKEHEQASYYIPYQYEVSTPRGTLHYFGTRHFLDSKNHQFDKLCHTIRSLKPSIVVVEHHQELSKSAHVDTRDDFIKSIQKMSLEDAVSLSESGLAVKLALEIGAAVESPEPTDQDQFLYLERKGYSHEQIASYFLTRAASMLPLWKHRMNLHEVLEFRKAQLTPSWPWELGLLSADSVNEYLKRSFQLEIFESPSEVLASLIVPLKPEDDPNFTVLNSIANTCTSFRDIRIVSRLLEIVSEYDTILVVFGSSHAIRQEKALRELIRDRRLR